MKSTPGHSRTASTPRSCHDDTLSNTESSHRKSGVKNIVNWEVLTRAKIMDCMDSEKLPTACRVTPRLMLGRPAFLQLFQPKSFNCVYQNSEALVQSESAHAQQHSVASGHVGSGASQPIVEHSALALEQDLPRLTNSDSRDC